MRNSVRIGLATTTVATLIAMVAAIGIVRAFSDALETTDTLMSRTHVLYTEALNRSIEAIDSTSIAARDEFVDYARGVPGATTDPYNLLRRLADATPVIGGIAWVNAEGQRTHTSISRNAAPLNVAAQPQFAVHVERREPGLYISDPFRSVLDGRWLVIASRRAEGPDGGFVGVVQIAINLGHFDGIYRKVRGHAETDFAMFKLDGTCLVRSIDSASCLGKKLPEDEFMSVVRTAGEMQAFRGAIALDGPEARERVGVASRLPGVGLIAINSVVLEPTLENWRRETAFAVALALLGIVAIGFGGRSLARAAERESANAERLHVAWLAAKSAGERAEAANRAKSTFLSNTSHELRTPLNAVIGFAELLKLNRDGRLSQAQIEYLSLIVEGGQHLLRLINDILDLATVEAGRLAISLEGVDLGFAIERARRSMANLAKQYGVELSTAVPEGLPEIRADDRRLHQVLLNLISNAIKYNRPKGRVTLRVLPTDGERLRVEIEDTGIGIPADRRAGMFEPFNRMGAERMGIEGTGLGLALTKRLVEAMRGSIDYRSEPGRGTVFWLDLPIRSATEAPNETPKPAPEAHDLSRFATGSVHVLCIDDNANSRRLIAEICAVVPGVVCHTASSAEQGLSLAQTRGFDAVLLDINLPGMDGFEAMGRLRALPGHATTPVIAISAAATPKDIRRGEAAGFFRYLTKPIDIGAFVDTLRQAIAPRA